MSDPLERATSRPPPTLGEGCTSRYDPEAMSSEDGTAFPDAAELWQRLRKQSDAPGQAPVPEVPPEPQ
ncbi:MAG: hypothetical protein V4812_21535 [Pseudomonadota bacterium]